MQKKIYINKDNNNNDFEIIQKAFFFFSGNTLWISTPITFNSFNPYELRPQEQGLLAVSLLVFWINEKSMTIISAGTRSTHQWIYKWVDYTALHCTFVLILWTFRALGGIIMKYSVILILLGLLALTQAEDDETMALVRSCKTIQRFSFQRISDSFFFVPCQLLLALICISIVLKKRPNDQWSKA